MSMLEDGYRNPKAGGSRNRPHGNLAFLRIAVVVLFGLLGLRLAYMQIVNGADYARRSRENHISEQTILPTRGEIIDRNGVALTANIPVYTAQVVPELLPDPTVDDTATARRTAIYQKIEQIIGMPALEIQSRVKAQEDAGTPYIAIPLKTRLSQDEALMLTEAATDMPGVSVAIMPGRDYVGGPSFADILGYIKPQTAENRDYYKKLGYDLNQPVGLQGLEERYENDLRGTPGYTASEQDAQGRQITALSSKDPVPGNTLKLAIDSGLQNYIAELLTDTLSDPTWHARNAAAVVMSPKTGSVYAMVSVPTFDPNILADTEHHEAEYNALAADDVHQPLVNHATAAAAPGSTFKLITSAAALENGNITASTSIDIPSATLDLKGENGQIFTLHDWRAQGPGINLYKGIAYSSNIYMNMISCGILGQSRGLAADYGTQATILGAMARNFGLGGPSGIDLAGESDGRIPSPAWKKQVFSGPEYTRNDWDWFYGDTCNMSIGQGDVLATPIQIARMTAAVANGGKLLTPHIVDQVLSPDGKVVRDIPTTSKQVPVSAEHLLEIREGMRLGVTDPAGAAIRVNEGTKVAVAGKTGTAEFFEKGVKLQHAWFTGFAPYDDPDVVVTVYYDLGVGGDKAAPTAGRIIDYFEKNVKH